MQEMQLQNQVESLKRLNGALKSDYESLALALDAAESDLVVANAMLAKLRQGSAQAEQSLKGDLRVVLEQSERGMAAMTAENERLKREVAALQAVDTSALARELDAARLETALLKKDLASVLGDDERRIQELSKKDSLLQAEVKRLTREGLEREKRQRAETEALRAEAHAAKVAAKETEKRLGRELEAARSELSLRADAERRVAQELDTVKRDKAASEARLQREIEELANTERRLLREVEAVKSERSEAVKKLTGECDALRAELAARAEAERWLSDERERARHSEAQAKMELEELARLVREGEASRRRSVDESKQLEASLRKDLNAALSHAESMKRDLEAARAQNGRLVAAESSLKRELESAAAQNGALSTRESNLKRDLAEALRMMDSLVAEAERRANLKVVDPEVERLKADAARLEAERNEAQSSLRDELARVEVDRNAAEVRLRNQLGRLEAEKSDVEERARRQVAELRAALAEEQQARTSARAALEAAQREGRQLEMDLKRELSGALNQGQALAERIVLVEREKEKEVRELTVRLDESKRHEEHLLAELSALKKHGGVSAAMEIDLRRDLAASVKQAEGLAARVAAAEKAREATRRELEQEQTARRAVEAGSKRDVEELRARLEASERQRRDEMKRAEVDREDELERVRKQLTASRVSDAPVSTPVVAVDVGLVAGLKRELSDALRMAEDLGGRLAGAERARDSFKVQVARLEQSVSEKESQIESFRKEAASLATQYASLKKESHATEMGLRDQLVSAGREAERYAQDAKALQRQVKEAETSLRVCQVEVQRLGDELAHPRVVERMKRQVQTLEQEAATEASLSAMRLVETRQIADLKREVSRTEQGRDEMMREVERLRVSEANLKREVHALEEEAPVRRSEAMQLEAVRRELEEADRERERAVAEIARSREEAARLRRELADAENRASGRGVIDVTSSGEDSLRRELEQERSRSAELERCLAEAKKRLGAAVLMSKDASAVAQLRAVVEDQEAEIQKLRRQEQDRLFYGQNASVRMKELEEGLETALAESSKWKKRVGELQQEAEAEGRVKEQLNLALAEAQSLAREWEHRSRRAERQLEELVEASRKKEPELDDVRRKLSEVGKARDALVAELERVQESEKAKAQVLLEDRASIAKELEVCKRREREASRRAAELQSQVDDLEAKRRQEAAGLKRHVQEVGDAASKARLDHERELRQRQALEDSLRDEIKSVTRRISRWDLQKRDESVASEEMCRECDSLRKEAVKLRNTVAGLGDANYTLEAQLRRLESAARENAEQFALQTSREEELRAVMAQSAKTVAELQAETKTLRSELRKMREHPVALEHPGDGVEVEELRRDLSQALQLAEEFGTRLEEANESRRREKDELEARFGAEIESLEKLMQEKTKRHEDELRRLESIGEQALKQARHSNDDLGEHQRLAEELKQRSEEVEALRRAHLAETSALVAEVNTLTETMRRTESDSEGLKTEAVALKATIATMKEVELAQKRELDEARAQCAEFAFEIERLRQSAASPHQGTCGKCSAVLNECEARLQAKDQEVEELQTRLRAATFSGEQTKQLRAQLELLTSELDGARAGSERLVNVLVDKEDAIASLQRAMEASHQRETERLKELDLLTERLSTHESQSEVLRRRVAEQALQLQEEKDASAERVDREAEELAKRSREDLKRVEERHQARLRVCEAEKQELQERMEQLRAHPAAEKEWEAQRRELLDKIGLLQEQTDSAKKQLLEVLRTRQAPANGSSRGSRLENVAMTSLLNRERDTENSMRLLITELQERLIEAESKLFMLSE